MMLGTNPPDYTTDTGKVRLLGNDNYYDPTNGYLFSDGAVNAFLTLASGNVLRAAAFMLRAIAADEALVTRVIRTDDLSVNGAQTAESLRKLADDLDAKADRDEESFEVVFDSSTCYPEGVPVWGRHLVELGRCR